MAKALSLCAIVLVVILLVGLIGLGTGFMISPFAEAPVNTPSPGVSPFESDIKNLIALESQPKTRASRYVLPTTLPHGVFVGVGLSGGGSRAANFGAAALLELQQLGLMDLVSAISSVSGGSLTAAYYGLYKDDPQRWNEPTVRSILRQDFESALFWQNVRQLRRISLLT